MRDKGIVTQEEYEAKRAQIVEAQGDVVVSHIKLARTPGQLNREEYVICAEEG